MASTSTNTLTNTTTQKPSQKKRTHKLSATLFGFGLSVATLLGTASAAMAVPTSWLYLPSTGDSGTRNAINVDGTGDVEVYWEPISSGTQVCLEFGGNVSWWKGVKTFDNNNSFLGFVARTDAAGRMQCDTFGAGELGRTGAPAKVELWKAKVFGVHTHMSSLMFDPTYVDGKRVVFRWVAE